MNTAIAIVVYFSVPVGLIAWFIVSWWRANRRHKRRTQDLHDVLAALEAERDAVITRLVDEAASRRSGDGEKGGE